MRAFKFFIFISLFIYIPIKTSATDSKDKRVRVVFIGIDGLSIDGVKKAKTPNLDYMMDNGSYSLNARGVFPTSSGPNWASMILGMGPELHGVISNDWQNKKGKKIIQPIVEDEKKFSISVFDCIKNKNSDLYLAVVHEWTPISYYFNPKSTDFVKNTKNKKETLDEVYKQLKYKDADFVFIHLDEIDGAGHSNGWKTKAYYKAIEDMDSHIGMFFDKLKKDKIFDDIIFIVSSDHGGMKKSHGGNSMDELLIPWIAYGPNIKKNKNIKTFISTYDTPATIAYLFSADFPKYWEGKPIKEILAKDKKQNK